MAHVRIIRIVVASPSDVQAERDSLPTVLEELNNGIARDRGLRLELARWETDAYPGFHPDGPQGLIDPLLRIEDCDLLIGLFWKRFGTPVTDAQSGTEHEFRHAYDAWKQNGRPQIMVYFNQKPYAPKTKAETDQWGQVLDFQERFPKEGLWWPYKTRPQFEKLIRTHITTFLRQENPLSPNPSRTGPPPVVSTSVQEQKKRYLARLLTQCRALPLAALGGDAEPHKAVTLEQVYIELNTTLSVPESVLEKVTRGELKGGSQVRTVPDTGKGDEGRKQRRMALGRAEREEEMRPLPALEALRLTPRLALLGDPGSGKSCFARMVIAELVEGKSPAGLATDLLPVLIVLRDLISRLTTIDLDALPGAKHAEVLADAVRDQIIADLASLDSSSFAEGLIGALTTHRCLLVFDGLDEVPQEMRGLVHKAVLAVVDRYDPPRAIVTCRTRSYVDEAVLPRFEPYTLAGFDERQIEHFAQAWYSAQRELGRFDAAQAEQKARDLAQAALTPDLYELAANPMLLTTMALIHQQEVGLPRERVRLYSKAVDVLLYRWQKEKVSYDALSALFRNERRLRGIMERLAYEAHLVKRSDSQEEGADLPRHHAQDLLEEMLEDANQARAFLNYVDQRAGLLVGRGGNPNRPTEYSFPHRTFQEYLAGCYLLTGSDSDRVRQFYAHAAEGDRWNLVMQLGAEELFYNTRNGEPQLLHLAYNLLADRLTTEQEQRAAVWSGQMAALAGSKLIERDTSSPNGGKHYLQRIRRQLVTLLSGTLPAPERCLIGDVLGQIDDPRFRPDAWFLPDDPLLGFVEIPAGPFLMGSDKEHDPLVDDDELPQHSPLLPLYYIARYPVTVAQFCAFVEQTHYLEDEDALQGLPNHPVVYASWHDAIAYCQWLTEQLRAWEGTPEPLATLLKKERWEVMLPSEAEWEKAARGRMGRIYPWGDEFDANKANMGETGIGRTSAVGCFPLGATPEGIMDLSGNVWEWTRSLFKDYPYPNNPQKQAERENLKTEKDEPRGLRGGAFFVSPGAARCASRRGSGPGGRYDGLGFRVVVRPCLSSDL